MRNFFCNLLFWFALFFYSTSYSQLDDTGGDLPPTDDPPVPSAPIDGLILLLVFFGLIYAFYVLKKGYKTVVD